MNRKKSLVISAVCSIILLGLIFWTYTSYLPYYRGEKASERWRCRKFKPYYIGNYNTRDCISAGCKTQFYLGEWSCVPKFSF